MSGLCLAGLTAAVLGCAGEHVVVTFHDVDPTAEPFVVGAIGSAATANRGDCGLLSIEVPNPYVAGSGVPIVITQENTTDMDLSCTLHPILAGDFAGLGGGGSVAADLVAPVPANSTLTFEWLFEQQLASDGSLIVGGSYDLEACSYSRGAVSEWDGFLVDQDESNRCLSLVLVVIAP